MMWHLKLSEIKVEVLTPFMEWKNAFFNGEVSDVVALCIFIFTMGPNMITHTCLLLCNQFPNCTGHLLHRAFWQDFFLCMCNSGASQWYFLLTLVTQEFSGNEFSSCRHICYTKELFRNYHHFQNHYTHEILIFKLFRGLQLQLSGVFRIN